MISVNKLFSSRRVVAESPFAVPRWGAFSRRARIHWQIISFISKPATIAGDAAQLANPAPPGRIGLASRTYRTACPVKTPSPDAANVGYRTAARRNAKIASNETGSKKFFLNLFRSDRPARRALLSTSGCDKIFGSDPPHSRPPPKFVSRTFKTNNWRGRLAA